MRLSAAAAGLATALVLTGCAMSDDAAQSEELSGTLTVFAAASLTEVFDEIADRFEEEHPDVTVVLGYGGSSGLAAQIVEGAPVDVFAAASDETMDTVVDGGMIDVEGVFATNTLEIAVPSGNPGAVTGLADFARPELAIAVCAVEVPCGAAADTAFDSAGVSPSVDTYEQDVKAVLTKVRLGEVDAGLVYRTDILSAGDAVDGISFAEAAGAVGSYPIGVLRDAPNLRAALAFVEFVDGDVGKEILSDAGFGPAS
ncbi:molybdate transport system substrate-binding protein [Microbacteriaceae bacterium SG_E_30_P1]|uniref:Molybdate transport system substrate-binding protein n=1 Tax=Antiquaquibacter oligotrophicus TaxID=2880260 RepID=A0ABT6KNK7_9MICO|nr:molybdate ABC transporter substrate-binding protein [Antiquaquibacter oligotrophicus]MDH6181596.1 molybdate transport system substrate-binding protein [Antiquaquibacter oligotrophicus]UDF12718.1 molybdate ABC transporter substrate-binding protein [Antiquaquibacter oligotrophicus]